VNVTVEDILAKIPTLPADYASHVHLGEIVAGAMLAEVDSFTEHTVARSYPASIKRGEKEGELVADCKCPAKPTILCKHIVAFYAVAKHKDLAVIAALAKREAPPAESTAPLVSQAEPRIEVFRRDICYTEALRLIAKAEEGYTQAHEDLLAALALMRKEA